MLPCFNTNRNVDAEKLIRPDLLTEMINPLKMEIILQNVKYWLNNSSTQFTYLLLLLISYSQKYRNAFPV